MITRRTRVQLLVFALITVLGVGFVGARYAKLDRYFRDPTYTVTVHLKESGGIFSGAEVTYRGVGVGTVGPLTLTDEGVDAELKIENSAPRVPADTLAVVGNKSAIGEQYVELQPQADGAPYLENGSQIASDRTATPIATQKLLQDISDTVGSVDNDSLRTVIKELGIAFDGTGPDLQRIIDTSNSFIEAADDNFSTTTSLIEKSNTVLRTQVDSASSIRSFADDLSLFSTTLAGSDEDLRRVINNGSATANEVRAFIEANDVDLSSLIRNLVTTAKIGVKRLPGLRQLLVVYPYAVEGGFTVVSKDKRTGLYDAHFGLVLTSQPHLCYQGYENTDRRVPQDGENRPVPKGVGCTEPIAQGNARGSQNLFGPGTAPRAPVVATYDDATGKIRWTDGVPDAQTSAGTVADDDVTSQLGKESWKWWFLQTMGTPTTAR